MPIVVDRLRDPTSGSVTELIAASEQLGLRLVRRLVEEWANGANRFDRPGEILFGAWVDGRLVGVCGLNVDPYAGNERVGRLRHLYVLSAFRRQGVGRQLVARVIEAAHGRFDDVRLRTNNSAAAPLRGARLSSLRGARRLSARRKPCVGADRLQGSRQRGGMMSDTRPVLACDLGALSVEERARRSVLATHVAAHFRKIRETQDEWLLLERRCCPFLRLELHFEQHAGPVWLAFEGGAGVKDFLAAAGFKASS